MASGLFSQFCKIKNLPNKGWNSDGLKPAVEGGAGLINESTVLPMDVISIEGIERTELAL